MMRSATASEDSSAADRNGGSRVALAATAAINVIDTVERGPRELPGPDVPAGLAIKRLRAHAQRGDWTWLGAGAPEYLEERAEIHPRWRRRSWCAATSSSATAARCAPGDIYWRLPNVRHGPIYCRSGRLIFFRTKGGGLSTTYEDVPGWRELVAQYRSRAPFYQGP